MLSSTADSLFWLARYMERAENMARLVDMGRRMRAIPGSGPDCLGGRRLEWPAILAATGCTAGYNDKRATPGYAPLDEADATIRYLLLEPENASSVRASFEAARANARAARGALTREMWESVNDAWIFFRSLNPCDIRNGALSPLLEMIKTAAAQFRGAAEGSALRNDGYEFLRLGFAVERLDCTARLLDVKIAPVAANAVVDRYRWMALLRAAGQLLAYRAHYRSDYDGALITEFLIKRAESPRSLMYAALQAEQRLSEISAAYGAPAPCLEQARALTRLIRETDLEAMTPDAMHRFLSAVIAANGELTAAVATSFYFSPAAPLGPAAAQADVQVDREKKNGARRKKKRAAGDSAAATATQIQSNGVQMQM